MLEHLERVGGDGEGRGWGGGGRGIVYRKRCLKFEIEIMYNGVHILLSRPSFLR